MTMEINQIHTLNVAFAKTERKLTDELARLTQREEEAVAQLTEQISQARMELENLLRSQAQREREISAQLLDLQQQAAKERVELVRSQNEQESALHRQYAEREKALAQQLQVGQQEVHRLQQEWAQHESLLNREIAALQNEAQALRHAHQLQLQQHGFELSAQQDKYNQLLQSNAALEVRLKAGILLEQQTVARLRQALETMHTSLTWRLTAPLRQLASLISPSSSTDTTTSILAEAEQPHALIPVIAEASPVHVQQKTEPLMMSSIPVTSPKNPIVATTLDELLACHDQHFVRSAYQTLLGREPDPEGLAYYLGRLRAGYSKMRILAQLRLSDEGKTRKTHLPGLDAALQRYRRGQYPLLGGLFRWLEGTEGNHPTERKLRGIENQILILVGESNQRFDQLDHSLAGMRSLVVQQTQSMSTLEHSLARIHSVIDQQAYAAPKLEPSLNGIDTHSQPEISDHKNRRACDISAENHDAIGLSVNQIFDAGKFEQDLRFLTIEDLIQISSTEDQISGSGSAKNKSDLLAIEDLLEISTRIN